MKIVIVIATHGRRNIMTQTLADLRRQSRFPDEVIIVGANSEDLPRIDSDIPFPTLAFIGPKGATHQRNAGIEASEDSDIILFMDDDFILDANYIRNAETLFIRHPEVAIATGEVLLDGIHGPGISLKRALAELDSQTGQLAYSSPKPIYNAYGCNMIARSAHIRDNDIRFDDRLPLYSWLEDVDFSRQLGLYGQIVKSDALLGVHLGTKVGRSSGRRLGYSQIANPLYLQKKKTMERRRALSIMARNFLSNLVKSIRPEHEIDRRGRLIGNLLALRDLFTGNLYPERVLELQ